VQSETEFSKAKRSKFDPTESERDKERARNQRQGRIVGYESFGDWNRSRLLDCTREFDGSIIRNGTDVTVLLGCLAPLA
jgi:hypothetical protein